jgi:hypothetical protein
MTIWYPLRMGLTEVGIIVVPSYEAGVGFLHEIFGRVWEEFSMGFAVEVEKPYSQIPNLY